MDCPSLDIISIDTDEYPEILKPIKITLRGVKNLFNIFFSTTDIANSFNVTIPPEIDTVWINTPSGRDKYLSYPSLKRFLFQIVDKKPLAESYMRWVDSMLFSSSKIKPFFKNPLTDYDSHTEDSLCDGYEEAVSECDFSQADIISTLKWRIMQLEHKLEIKKKDIDILTRDIQIRDMDVELKNKEIEILKMVMSSNTDTVSEWI